mmetsp:Transcript_19647/g.63936  ORF Transcript_19647/g.63936 Transcript_19647/m.63936 type:complete len:243 (+) Transcript_19647:433-1161(+)
MRTNWQRSYPRWTRLSGSSRTRRSQSRCSAFFPQTPQTPLPPLAPKCWSVQPRFPSVPKQIVSNSPQPTPPTCAWPRAVTTPAPSALFLASEARFGPSRLTRRWRRRRCSSRGECESSISSPRTPTSSGPTGARPTAAASPTSFGPSRAWRACGGSVFCTATLPTSRTTSSARLRATQRWSNISTFPSSTWTRPSYKGCAGRAPPQPPPCSSGCARRFPVLRCAPLSSAASRERPKPSTAHS